MQCMERETFLSNQKASISSDEILRCVSKSKTRWTPIEQKIVKRESEGGGRRRQKSRENFVRPFKCTHIHVEHSGKVTFFFPRFVFIPFFFWSNNRNVRHFFAYGILVNRLQIYIFSYLPSRNIAYMVSMLCMAAFFCALAFELYNENGWSLWKMGGKCGERDRNSITYVPKLGTILTTQMSLGLLWAFSINKHAKDSRLIASSVSITHTYTYTCWPISTTTDIRLIYCLSYQRKHEKERIWTYRRNSPARSAHWWRWWW